MLSFVFHGSKLTDIPIHWNRSNTIYFYSIPTSVKTNVFVQGVDCFPFNFQNSSVLMFELE